MPAESAPVVPLTSWQEVLAATGSDGWARLNAEATPAPVRAWRLDAGCGAATAWSSPDPTDLGEFPPVVHALGDAAAVAALTAQLVAARPTGIPVTLPVQAEALLPPHGVALDVQVRWHYRALTPPAPAPPPRHDGPDADGRASGVAWLPPAGRREALALLERHAPDLLDRADVPQVRRWAGLRDAGGALVAVCADASPRALDEGGTVGLLASVAVHGEHRRRGLGSRLVRGAVRAMAAEGRTSVGLAVYAANTVALATYDRLGFDDRPWVTGKARPLSGS